MAMSSENGMMESKKVVATKVAQLRPGTSGHTLTVKVVNAKAVVLQRGGNQSRPFRLVECIVGDETGSIVFIARNEQVDIMKEGSIVILRNAKIDMYRGSMRLAVDKSGRIEAANDSADFAVKTDSNLSLIEFEQVYFDE